DASFGAVPAAMEYAATLFMLLAALPFVRYVQLVAGTARPLLHDPQVRAFFATVAMIVLIIATWKMIAIDTPGEESLRKSLFNTVS
ncbi:potassium transporter TrkH, partial [Halomonas marinisediminis]